ncbi:MAG: 50S ribosomal protein L3 [Bdellovibrionales bacterium]|nr:50S ribosomal protein L3 [Bdellovibrionales bacterium]
MFKKVKDILKKKNPQSVEEKPKGKKPTSKTEEVSASPKEKTPMKKAVSSAPSKSDLVQEKAETKRSASDASEKKPAVKPEKQPTSTLKAEESKEQKAEAAPAPSSEVKTPEKRESAKPEKQTTSTLKAEESKEQKTKAAPAPSSEMKTPEKRESVSGKAEEAEPQTDSTSEKKIALQKDQKSEAASDSAPSQKIPEETSTTDSHPADTQVSKTASKPAEPKRESITLQGLFAFKLSMTSLYDEQGRRVPVTALKYKPWVVSQIKTKEKEGYSAAQVACWPQKNNRSPRAQIKHLTPAGFKEGARYIREIRQELPENIKVGQELSIESLKKGDRVQVSSRSKGRGYAGVVKRWGFRGGPASHGSKIHRKTGSIGQCTEPSRVVPGRKMPGQYGFETITLNSVPVVDVLPQEGVIFVKGPVSGARNTLVSLKKVREAHA